jgi:hypothetical protein
MHIFFNLLSWICEIEFIYIWILTNAKYIHVYIYAGRSSHQLLRKHGGRTTRALYLASSGSNTTTSAYHTEDNCFLSLDDETKTKLITLIFCTAKCYCHSDRKEDVCYCCQPGQGCYDTLQECQAKCPVCNPTCPDGTTADGQQLHETKNATL